MTSEKKRRVRRIYGYVLAGLCLFCGILLILACLNLYFSGGETPYSRERVWETFLSILIPVALCVLGILGGAAVTVLCPLADEKLTTDARASDRLRAANERLVQRTAHALFDEPTAKDLAKERRSRQIAVAAAALVSTLAAVPPLFYLLDLSHFPNAALNSEVLSALVLVLPCTAVALAACTAASCLNAASLARENELLRAAAQGGASVANEREEAADEPKATSLFFRLSALARRNESRLILLARCAVGALGIAFVLLGIAGGSMNDVLEKAVRICTECIGLG